MVMKAADLRELKDPPRFRWLSWSMVGRVHIQRLVRPPSVVVAKVTPQDPLQMPLAQHDDVVQALSANTPDQPLDVRILPWAPTSDDDLLDAHVGDAALEVSAVDAVAVTEQKARCFIPGERLDDLLGRPLGGWIRGDVEVENATAIVGEDQEDEEDLECDSGNDEEVNGHRLGHVIAQEGHPGR